MNNKDPSDRQLHASVYNHLRFHSEDAAQTRNQELNPHQISPQSASRAFHILAAIKRFPFRGIEQCIKTSRCCYGAAGPFHLQFQSPDPVYWLHQGASTHLRRSYSPIHGNAAERLPGRAPAAPGRGGRCHGRDIVRRGVGARGEAPRRPLPLPYGSGSRAGRDTFHPWAGAGT